MDNWLSLVAPIAAVGGVYVLVPVVAHTYSRFRGVRLVSCPETQAQVKVELDATQAAVTAAVGPPEVRVKRCARWPEHADCGQECVAAMR